MGNHRFHADMVSFVFDVAMLRCTWEYAVLVYVGTVKRRRNARNWDAFCSVRSCTALCNFTAAALYALRCACIVHHRLAFLKFEWRIPHCVTAQSASLSVQNMFLKTRITNRHHTRRRRCMCRWGVRSLWHKLLLQSLPGSRAGCIIFWP